jgi:hypothetical protein
VVGERPGKEAALASVSEDEFLGKLRDEVRSGYGLVPFIGSGCSADSGIVMGMQFTDYLGWTMRLCLDKDAGGPWDLRTNGWPPDPDQASVTDARRWICERFKRIAQDCKIDVIDDPDGRIRQIKRVQSPERYLEVHEPELPSFLMAPELKADPLGWAGALRKLGEAGIPRGGVPRPNRSPTSYEAIVERGVRALHDWRATLQFLSELHVETDEKDEEGGRLTLADPDETIIDRFNVHITRGRRPNPIHFMLSHLREPARMRVILTTNFDTLIEDAFRDHMQRIDPVPVSIKGLLPDPDLVHSRDTVVKMHGALTETRADFSLDAEPSADDKRRFFHIVRGRYPRERTGFIAGHLLVAGYSGNDRRCVELMKFVLDTDRHAKVFWICHSRKDEARVAVLFPEADYEGRLIVTMAKRIDLLLLEYYQQLCLRLPPGGDNFPLNHDVAPQASGDPAHAEIIRTRVNKVLADARAIERRGFRPSATPHRDSGRRGVDPAARWKGLADHQVREPQDATGEGPLSRVLVVDLKESCSGVLPALRRASDDLAAEHGLSPVWLELEDYSCAAAVAQQLLQTIASKRGLFNLSHAVLCPPRFWAQREVANGEQVEKLRADWLQHLSALMQHFGTTADRWLVLLYGRNGPGGCSGWLDVNYACWNEGTYRGLEALLDALGSAGFVVLYAPYSEDRRKRDEKRKENLVTLLRYRFGELTPESLEERVKRTFAYPQHVHDWRNCAFLKAGEIDLGESRPLDRFESAMKVILNDELAFDAVDADLGGATNRFSFLYGLTLFRQSRQYSAFLSEGIFSCPLRFNALGVDNDYERFARLRGVIERVQRFPRLFLRKPGGFAWMYRDVRLGVRTLADVASEAVHQPTSQWRPRDGDKWLWRRRDTRARAHFHVADWYERAFLASGHAGTLMEAVHHFFLAAVTVTSDQPGDPEGPESRWAWRGLHRWLVSVTGMIRALRIGRSAIRFWMEQGQRLDWFHPKTIDVVLGELRKAAMFVSAELSSGSEYCARLLRMLGEELRLLGNEQQPAGRILKGITLQGPLDLKAADDPDGGIAGIPVKLGTSEATWWRDGSLFHSAAKDLLDTLYEAKTGARGEPSAGRDPSGPAATAGHAFAPRPSEPRSSRPRTSVTKRFVRDWRAKYFDRFLCAPADSTQWIQELIEFAYLALRRATLDERLKALGCCRGGLCQRCSRPALRRETGETWLTVTALTNAAIEVAYFHPPGNEEFIMVMRSRAEAIYGLALGHLHRFYEAHRHINNAHALAMRSRSPRTHVLLGILELRRAEVHLIEAELLQELSLFDTRLLDEGQPLTAPDWHDGLAPEARATHEQNAQESLLKQIDHAHGGVRRAAALRDDAWCALERGEALLGGHTHGSAWWARLRTLQLWALSFPQGRPVSTQGEQDVSKVPAGDRSISRGRPLTQRIRQDVRGLVNRLWNDGRVASPDDWHNRLRLWDYYSQARRALPATRAPRTSTGALEAEIAEEEHRAKKAVDAIANEPEGQRLSKYREALEKCR